MAAATPPAAPAPKSFRARQLDPAKALNIYNATDHADILQQAETAARAVATHATGMEQEEEEEVHIREAIEAQQREGQLRSNHTIPVPEIQELDISSDKPPFEVPADYIHHQIYMQDPDRTDYDMDDDDVTWLKQFNAQRETPLDEYTFETMMHRLEQNTLHGIIKDEDIPPYLQTDSETAAAVRDYFQQKLSELGEPYIMPRLKPENPDGSSTRDAYVAFRKRTERMQTRKNRKNDETSFMHMLKMRRDFERCRTMLGLIERREQDKRDLLDLTLEVYQERFKVGDWDGKKLDKCQPWLRAPPPAQSTQTIGQGAHPEAPLRLRIKLPNQQQAVQQHQQHPPRSISHKLSRSSIRFQMHPYDPRLGLRRPQSMYRRNEDQDLDYSSAATEPGYGPDNPFRFRRRRNVFYHAPYTELAVRSSRKGQFWMAKTPDELGMAFSDSDTEADGNVSDSGASPPSAPAGGRRARVVRPILRGYCRRRIGRGGRVLIDRIMPELDSYCELSELTREQEEDLRAQDEWVHNVSRGSAPSVAMAAAVGGSGGGGGWSGGAGGPVVDGAALNAAGSGTPMVVRGAATPTMNTSAVAAGIPGHRSASSSGRNIRVPSRIAGSASPNPYAKAYERRDRGSTPPAAAAMDVPQIAPAAAAAQARLPMAGTDFGSGAEDVSSGPRIRVERSGQMQHPEWLALDRAAQLAQTGQRMHVASKDS